MSISGCALLLYGQAADWSRCDRVPAPPRVRKPGQLGLQRSHGGVLRAGAPCRPAVHGPSAALLFICTARGGGVCRRRGVSGGVGTGHNRRCLSVQVRLRPQRCQTGLTSARHRAGAHSANTLTFQCCLLYWNPGSQPVVSANAGLCFSCARVWFP